MGTAEAPKPAKFFVAYLVSDRQLLTQAELELIGLFGPVERRSGVTPWAIAKYYQDEMGAQLYRGFLSFESLVAADSLASAKLRTAAVEDRLRDPQTGRRRVNLDPGYLDAFKVVLASTKNASQRIYLSSGIYAEATLFFSNGAFHGWPYTYPDYLWPSTLAFFAELRRRYLAQLRPV